MVKLSLTQLSQSQMGCIYRYVQGVFNRNPPIKKSMKTWDIDIALDYFKASGSNNELPLNDLAGKISLSLLILLSRMCRIGEVAQLDLKHMEQTQGRLTFTLPKPTKTFTVDKCGSYEKNLQTLFVDSFPEPELCPYSAIMAYLSRTAGLRGSVTKLFLLCNSSLKAASPTMLSCWTKMVMSKAGLGKLKIHPGRSAATSCALLLGLPMECILKQAGWHSGNTFIDYYLKPLDNSALPRDKHKFIQNREGSHHSRRIENCTDRYVKNFKKTLGINENICSSPSPNMPGRHNSPSTSVTCPC